ncbi:MAG: metallophosphoesterase family protein [Mycobacteriales bacterium]
MQLLLLSDTHLPARGRDLPAEVWDAVEAADLVVHAGDWVSPDLLDRLEERARDLLGVRGNNDRDPALVARLPEVARRTVDGLRLAVVHETGDARGREARCDRAFPGTDVLVFGHSHVPWDSTTPAGLRLLNPGSCVDRRRQPHRTYLTAEVTGGLLTAVTLHRVAS